MRGSPVFSQPATGFRCRGWAAAVRPASRLVGPPDPPLAPPRQKAPRTQNACTVADTKYKLGGGAHAPSSLASSALATNWHFK